MNEKPKLIINNDDCVKNIWKVLGMTELLSYLKDSDIYDVSYHTERIETSAGGGGTIIYCNGKKIYLDLWEYYPPSYTPAIINAGFDIIIKLQHSPMPYSKAIRYIEKKQLLIDIPRKILDDFYSKIIPWTFFCSRMMNQFIGKEDTLSKLPDERIAFFCGKEWKCRHNMIKLIVKQEIEYISSSQENVSSGRPLSDEEYIHKMRTSKYGLILYGKSGHLIGAKNRREIDYMILKKPLLLNYKPFYYDPMIEGKHYIYIDENINLKDIENQYNIEEIAQNGYEWYKRNASPNGVAKTFLKIVNKEKV